MDNLCHTLAGLALAESGLKRKTALASVTAVIGANLPDVDAAIYWIRPAEALGFRRGWTHGILALAIWPFVLTLLMLLVGRLLKQKPDPRALLLLSAVTVVSHPLLDLMNTYGVRLLMPFSGHWFYGDTLFIIDPWVWLALVLGIVLARRARKRGSATPYRPARVALAAITAYIALMAALSAAGRGIIRRELAREGFAVRRVMVGPVPLTPLRKQAVADVGDSYTTAELSWLTGVSPDGTRIWKLGAIVFTGGEQWAKQDTLAVARAAALTPQGRSFLRWARFPFFALGEEASCPPAHVCLRDLRYFPQFWAEVAVPVGGALSSASSRALEQP